MLHTNLSTRPFYNVRAVRAVLWAIALIVIAVSVVNVVRILRLTAAQGTLGAHASESEDEARRLLAEAAAVRSQINPRELGAVTAAAEEANRIIDRRAFSWSDLFAQFERTLPSGVRITAVQPRLDRDGTFRVAMTVEARRAEDLAAFIESLETESTFTSVLPREEARTEDGLIAATLEGAYLPPGEP